jgi:hypothetical protein
MIFAATVQAAKIDGGIGFIGWGYGLIGGTNFLNSSGLNLTSGITFAVGGQGDYGTIADYTITSFSNINYDSFPPIPQQPLWTLTYDGHVYSFDLKQLSVVTRTAYELVLRGLGNLNATGFETTEGEWNFSATANNKPVFTFSSTAGSIKPVASVPEIDAAAGTSAIALLGGVMFLFSERARGRNKRNQASA